MAAVTVSQGPLDGEAALMEPGDSIAQDLDGRLPGCHRPVLRRPVHGWGAGQRNPLARGLWPGSRRGAGGDGLLLASRSGSTGLGEAVNKPQRRSAPVA